MNAHPPTRDCRTWSFDSRRWAHFAPRPDDIVIATYPKCGTTWMQRIVAMLVFQNTDALPVMDVSIWPDGRFQPIESVVAAFEAQTHRRFLKAHQPYDALPIYDEVRYIHVARDGRDAALSSHSHLRGLNDATLARLDAIGQDDDLLAGPFPRPAEDAAEYFHSWMTKGIGPDASNGLPLPSYFDFERSWWEARDRDNVLLVHYGDLKSDLDGEMRRVAAFLGIETPEALWPQLVSAAGFDAMKKEGPALLGRMTGVFRDGGESFINKGTNGRWRALFRADDLALYDEAMARLPTDCARWLEAGRLGNPEEQGHTKAG